MLKAQGKGKTAGKLRRGLNNSQSSNEYPISNKQYRMPKEGIPSI
jgi:hypothetical protein